MRELAAPFLDGHLSVCVNVPGTTKKIELDRKFYENQLNELFKTGRIKLPGSGRESEKRVLFTDRGSFLCWIRLYTKQYCTVDELTFKLANRATLAPAKIADAIFYAILSGEFDGHLLHKCGFPDYRSEDFYKGYVASRAQADQNSSPFR
jgi:hypothetical protein